MSERRRWQNLANFLNEAVITPNGSAVSDPEIPSAFYDADGTVGISYRFNGGNAKWFVVAGINAPAMEHYNYSNTPRSTT